MADELSVAQAAEELGTSPQTIRTYLRAGTLRGRQNPTNGVWSVRRKSVDEFLAKYGRLDGGRRRKSAAAAAQAELRDLRAQVAQLTNAADVQDAAILIRERDELRGRVAGLEDALARMRDAAELQRKAEAERSRVVDQLLAALAAADRADSLRRGALEILEDGLAGRTVPAHPGG